MLKYFYVLVTGTLMSGPSVNGTTGYGTVMPPNTFGMYSDSPGSHFDLITAIYIGV